MDISNPNEVPFENKWLDNVGGMANIIFDLAALENCPVLNGHRILPEGGRWVWGYSPFTGTVIVHASGKDGHRHYHVTLEKMTEAYTPDDKFATIYRPFAHYNGRVEWLTTRRVEIIKDHHFKRCPLYMRDVVPNLTELFKHRHMAQFYEVELRRLLIPYVPRNRHRGIEERVSPALEKAYLQLVEHVQTLHETSRPFEEHHIHSYTALMRMIMAINCMLDHENQIGPPLEGEDLERGYRYLKHVEDAVKIRLNDEMNRLIKEGNPRDAALMDMLGFDRTFEESFEKTLGIYCSINGKDKFSINDANKTNV